MSGPGPLRLTRQSVGETTKPHPPGRTHGNRRRALEGPLEGSWVVQEQPEGSSGPVRAHPDYRNQALAEPRSTTKHDWSEGGVPDRTGYGRGKPEYVAEPAPAVQLPYCFRWDGEKYSS